MCKWFFEFNFLHGNVLGLHIYNCVLNQYTSCVQIEQNGFIEVSPYYKLKSYRSSFVKVEEG